MRCVVCLLLVGVAGVVGCAGGGTEMNIIEGVPAPFELTLQSSSVDGRHVYYEVGGDGAFGFGGGRDAVLRMAKDVGVLNGEQMRAVWGAIQEGGLLDAEGRAFAKRERVKYSVSIRAGDVRHRFDDVDDAAPGVESLEELLFGYQAAMRYGDVFKPIEEKIQRSGGVVEKKE